MAVQLALNNGRSSLFLADSVAGLAAEVQQQFASRSNSGEAAKAVLSALLLNLPTPPKQGPR